MYEHKNLAWFPIVFFIKEYVHLVEKNNINILYYIDVLIVHNCKRNIT